MHDVSSSPLDWICENGTWGGTSYLWVSGRALVAWSPAICCPGGHAALHRPLQGGQSTGLIYESGTSVSASLGNVTTNVVFSSQYRL